MASRFDIATGRIPKNRDKSRDKSNILEQTPAKSRNLTNLKLVNTTNGQELELDTYSLNLSMEEVPASSYGQCVSMHDRNYREYPLALISISFSCPMNVAHRLIAR